MDAPTLNPDHHSKTVAGLADLEGLGEEVRRRVFDITGAKLEWEIKRVGVHENGDFGEVDL